MSRLGLRRLGVGSGRPSAPDPIAALFAGGAGGFDYNFAKLDRLFQDSGGVTAASLLDDPIGLALDSAQWAGRTLQQQVAGRPGLLINPSLVQENFVNWASSGGGAAEWVSNGVVRLTRSGSNVVLRQAVPVVAGRTYRLAASALRTVGSGNMVALIRDTSNTALSAVLNFNASAAEQATYWTATFTGNVRISFERTTTDGQGECYSASFKDVSTIAGSQAATSYRPRFQADGAKFDALDDRLLTTYSSAVETNCIVADVTLPTSFPASTQVICGRRTSGGSGHLMLGVRTNGRLGGGVGNQGTETIVGTTDLSGQRVIAGLSCNGSTVRLFVNDAEVYTGAQVGLAASAFTLPVGGLSTADAMSNFFGGHIKRLIVAQKSLDLAQFQAIRNRILSGA
ncbi:hypothetical protein CA606_18580 [Caulobacter vibrioides]|uniref:Uncharacterized protein n=1 Tax=Caulobacter vibrioides TaxID=155892 RepID=A0A290MQ09_CAUVI|nr:hypothetical protein [Caulobacter vibrioides]ATC34177.1 hypothetical protein CA606_18580 [Caulobacter vibrioides]